MRKRITHYFVLAAVLLGVPLACAWLDGRRELLDGLTRGDWRLAVRFALAALICGGFWEMWNFHSYAKWVYAVPYVHAFQLFEMPAVGFAGYLPFGLECAAVAAWIAPALVVGKNIKGSAFGAER